MTTPADLLAEIQNLWGSFPVLPTDSLDSEPTPPTAESERLFRDSCRFFDDIAAEMAKHNPSGLDSILKESAPMAIPCFRCGGLESYLAIIHNGESLRRDCCGCGRFIEFATWHDRQATKEAFQ